MLPLGEDCKRCNLHLIMLNEAQNISCSVGFVVFCISKVIEVSMQGYRNDAPESDG
jgi:hypothetical protein